MIARVTPDTGPGPAPLAFPRQRAIEMTNNRERTRIR